MRKLGFEHRHCATVCFDCCFSCPFQQPTTVWCRPTVVTVGKAVVVNLLYSQVFNKQISTFYTKHTMLRYTHSNHRHRQYLLHELLGVLSIRKQSKMSHLKYMQQTIVETIMDYCKNTLNAKHQHRRCMLEWSGIKTLPLHISFAH